MVLNTTTGKDRAPSTCDAWQSLATRRLRPTTKAGSFAKFAEDGIMILLIRVAANTGRLSSGGQLPIDLIVSGETHEFPSSGRGITYALLNHDIHASRLALDGVASNLLSLKQVIDDY